MEEEKVSKGFFMTLHFHISIVDENSIPLKYLFNNTQNVFLNQLDGQFIFKNVFLNVFFLPKNILNILYPSKV